MIVRGSSIAATMSQYLVDRIEAAENIEVITGANQPMITDDGLKYIFNPADEDDRECGQGVPTSQVGPSDLAVMIGFAAKELGLVNRITAKEELESEALAWAAELARKSPIAVQIAKKSFYSSEDMDYFQQFDLMNEAFARLCSSNDAKEGVKAFFEKRRPQWQEN